MRFASLAFGLCGLHFLAGCAATTEQRPNWSEPVAFPTRAESPRVLVYGSLINLMPQFDETPTLDLILYGPNDYGKAILRNPQGMTRLGDVLLVCDQGAPGVVAVNLASGRSVSWNDRRRAPRCPIDICSDGASRVFVADTANRSVLWYDAMGKFVQELFPPESVVATPTNEATVRRFRPAAVRFAHNTLYVGNMGDRRIDRYDVQTQGWLEPLIPPAGYPRIAAPTGLDIGPDGTLYIVDSLQQRVLRVSSDDHWLPPIGRGGRGAGQFVRPKSVCVTRSGMILVTDAGRQSVLVFNTNGDNVTELHESGAWKGLTLPAGILQLGDDPVIRATVKKRGWTAPSEAIVISDAMGGIPLVLAGVIAPGEEVQARER